MRRIRKTTKQYILVAFFCTLIIGGASAIFCTNFYFSMKEKHKKEYEIVENLLKDSTKTIYKSKDYIGYGEYITLDKVELVEVISSQEIELYIGEEHIGKKAKISLDPQTHILRTMVIEEIDDEDFREALFTGIKVSLNIQTGDVVDIRIFYPNGEDYVVLSKKNIKLEQDSLIYGYLHLSEEEILRMSSAMVDAYIYEGAYLYTVKYIEPSLQEAADITYLPRLENINLIKNSPNIISIAMKTLNERYRKELEARQGAYLGENESTRNIYSSSPSSQVLVDDSGFTYYKESSEEEYQLGE